MIKIYDMETLEEREILFRGGSIPSALTAQRRTPWR